MIKIWAYVAGMLAMGPALQAAELAPGQSAPDFTLKDQNGTLRHLADYRGKWVVLYFYPKDDTPGCTKEACQFRDDILGLRALKAEVVGISLDDAESHAKFSQKYSLPFKLLSDPEGKVVQQYGSLGSLLGLVRYAQRHTFIIDPQGRVARIYRKVDPDVHSRQVIDDLKALQRSAAAG